MKRKRLNYNLPRNLYADNKKGKYYFKYRHPVTGYYHGLGTDKSSAIDAAIRLNQQIGATAPTVSQRVHKIMAGGKTVSDCIDTYIKTSIDAGVAPNTLRTRRSLVKTIHERLGNYLIGDVSTKQIAEFLTEIKDSGKQRTAQAIRATLKEIFRDAIAEGWINHNPAIVTKAIATKVKRGRLSLEQFKTILGHAETLDPWVSNSMLLALLTGQRLSDIAKMQFKDMREGFLHVEQKKTGNLVRLSVDLSLDELDLSLSDVIRRCRDRALSHYLIHHTKRRTMSRPGEAVHENTVSKGFKRARNLTGLEWEGTPATFNEIRSLAGRLYKKQGVDPQALLGHKDAATTSIYLDPRQQEWVSVAMPH